MVQRLVLALLMLSCFGISDSVADAAQLQVLLKVGHIKGTARISDYQDHIVAQGFSYSVNQAGEWEEGDRLSGGRTTFSDMTVEKRVDPSSPSLALASASKEQFPRVHLYVVDARNPKSRYLTVIMEKAIVTNVKVRFDPQTQSMKETIKFRYRKAYWQVGNAKAGYDLQVNARM